jgi:pimeloyl-ACP methyl ester carboxylesterase/heme-degrading monooxygenase HmoA
MKALLTFVITSFFLNLTAQNIPISKMNYDTIRIASNTPKLNIGLLHLSPTTITGNAPVLFIHGSSFPSELSFGFKMEGQSWLDFMSAHNYDAYAIDLLGYGFADRYPQMATEPLKGNPPGRAQTAYLDVNKAVDYILTETGQRKVILIGHSWGASVAALYAEKYPEKVEKLVLFAPLVARDEKGKEDEVKTSFESLTPDERVSSMQDLTPAGLMTRLEPSLFTQWKNEWLQSDEKAVKKDRTKVYFPSGPSKDIEDLKHSKRYYHPSLVKAPVMVVRGEWDNFPNDEDALNLIGSFKNSSQKKYVIIGRGTHVLHLEKSRHRLYEEVNNFISEPINLSADTAHSIAVIFEVIPNNGEKQEYLDIAAQLKPELLKMDGFISIERFQSLTHPEKILSLSFWRDEKSILGWRNLEMHREAQEKGRSGIFKDYHLRIAHVVRDYGMFDRKETPVDSKQYHH